MAQLTQKQKDNATSKRLFRTYGITLEEYDSMLKKQGNVCKICQRPPTNRRLHTDHCHATVKAKINSLKIASGEWKASIDELNIYFYGRTKSEAIRKVKQALKKKSVRGLLCWPCNRALRSWNDDPDLMESAALYIRNHQTLLGA